MATTTQSEGMPGAGLPAFRRLLALTGRLVDHLGAGEFHSLYTLVPLMAQLIGLENPLFGSGRSPFSIIAILPAVKDPSVVKWDFDLTLEERRALIDEVYAMIAPSLLGEEEAYTGLLIDTLYHEEFRGREVLKREFRGVQREKFDLLASLGRGLGSAAPTNFAHVAHYGYTPDLLREHSFLKPLPPELFEEWCARSFPTVFELNFRGLGGSRSSVRGWIIVIANSTEQLLSNHRLRNVKITQCARLAEGLGAQVVGMAGLVAFFGKGGYQLSETFPGLSFTTGHAYTISNILEIARASAARAGLELSRATVAVVGAAGSIGSGCAKLFARLGVGRLILIDVLWQEHLEAVAAAVREISPGVSVVLTGRLREMSCADLTVVATNSPRTIIEPDFLKPGAIIIDDSFPKNVPAAITQSRLDVVALEGGIVRLPAAVEIDRARNVPNVMDVPLTRMISCQEVYGCLAETLTLAAHGQRGNYGLGPSDPTLAADIMEKAKGLGFGLAPLQFFGQAVSEQRFQAAVCARGAAAPTATPNSGKEAL